MNNLNVHIYNNKITTKYIQIIIIDGNLSKNYNDTNLKRLYKNYAIYNLKSTIPAFRVSD